MAERDIRPFAAQDGRTAYFVQASNFSSLGGGRFLRLVVIDEFGQHEDTPVTAPFDAAAPTLEEAIVKHLKTNGVVATAEAELERRRKAAPPEPVEPPAQPLDRATARFFSDSEW